MSWRTRMIAQPHNTSREAEESRTCPYCGHSNHPDWLTCGEGQTWGCGGALGEAEEAVVVTGSSVVDHRLVDEFGNDITDGFIYGDEPSARWTDVRETQPGITAREFDSAAYKLACASLFTGQREQLGYEFANLKAEIGRAFLPLFRPLLKLFFLEGRIG